MLVTFAFYAVVLSLYGVDLLALSLPISLFLFKAISLFVESNACADDSSSSKVSNRTMYIKAFLLVFVGFAIAVVFAHIHKAKEPYDFSKTLFQPFLLYIFAQALCHTACAHIRTQRYSPKSQRLICAITPCFVVAVAIILKRGMA